MQSSTTSYHGMVQKLLREDTCPFSSVEIWAHSFFDHSFYMIFPFFLHDFSSFNFFFFSNLILLSLFNVCPPLIFAPLFSNDIYTLNYFPNFLDKIFYSCSEDFLTRIQNRCILRQFVSE